MQYTIDSERGILLKIEDNEADAVFTLLEQRRAFVAEPTLPEIPIPEAVATLQRISAQQHAALDGCECDRIGVHRCGMCE